MGTSCSKQLLHQLMFPILHQLMSCVFSSTVNTQLVSSKLRETNPALAFISSNMECMQEPDWAPQIQYIPKGHVLVASFNDQDFVKTFNDLDYIFGRSYSMLQNFPGDWTSTSEFHCMASALPRHTQQLRGEKDLHCPFANHLNPWAIPIFHMLS